MGTAGFILLLVAFILYLIVLFKGNLFPDLDKVTTAQALVVLWLLLLVGDGLWLHSDSKPAKPFNWFRGSTHQNLTV